MSVEASLKGALNAKAVTGPPSAPGKDPQTADPNLGISLTVAGDYEVVVEHNRKAGTISYSYQLSATGTAAGNAVVVGGEAAGKTTGAFKVTRNDKGEIVQLSFVSTREGSLQGSVNGKLPEAVGNVSGANGKDGTTHAQATVTTTTLDLTDPADRVIAQNWLSGSTEQIGSPFNLTHSTMVPDRAPADGDPFQQLMYEKAKVSQVSYDDVTDVQKFGLEINAGFKMGFELSLENKTSTVDDSTYLGAPGDDGTRPMVDFTACS